MNHETINRNSHGSRSRIVRRTPDSDVLDPKKTLSAGQMAARIGALEADVLRVLRELGVEHVVVPHGKHGLVEYPLRALGAVRERLRCGR